MIRHESCGGRESHPKKIFYLITLSCVLCNPVYLSMEPARVLELARFAENLQNRSQKPFKIEIYWKKSYFQRYMRVNRAITLSPLKRASPGSAFIWEISSQPTRDLRSVDAGSRLGAPARLPYKRKMHEYYCKLIILRGSVDLGKAS